MVISFWAGKMFVYIFVSCLFTFPGDSMFNTLRRYGLYYDSSMSTAQRGWPYTLEYRMPHSCSVKPCPTESHPGKQFPISAIFLPYMYYQLIFCLIYFQECGKFPCQHSKMFVEVTGFIFEKKIV